MAEGELELTVFGGTCDVIVVCFDELVSGQRAAAIVNDLPEQF